MNKNLEQNNHFCYPKIFVREIIKDCETTVVKNISSIICMAKVKDKLKSMTKQEKYQIVNLSGDTVNCRKNIHFTMRLHYHGKFLNKDLRNKRKLPKSFSGVKKK